MKNLDFYHDLLNHSLCYKYNVQLEIAREFCKVIKENTLLKSILVTSSCPKYILDIFNKNGIKTILNNDDRNSLFYEFNELMKHIKSDKNFNYEIIVKNFCCGNQSDISKYIREINQKLVRSNNTNIDTIIGLLIDVPNYYLDAINLMNQYEYKFETQKASLTYRRLFIEVYRRLKNPSTFNYAIKELAQLIVLYYDVTHTAMDDYTSAFLNPIVEPIKSSMMNNILAKHQINLARTIDTLTPLDYIDVKESEEDLVENEVNTSSFELDMYGRKFRVDGNINIYDFGFTPKDIVSDVVHLIHKKLNTKKIDYRIDEQELMGLKKDHGLKILTVSYYAFHPVFIIEYNKKLFLLYKNTNDSTYDLEAIELMNEESKQLNQSQREIIGIDFDADVKYEFVI